MDKESAKIAVEALVKKYNRVVSEGRDGKYKEEETKKDFIIPLFRALGWDVENSAEVTAEEKISKKRVDYGFRINGIPKFFLEAKSFKEDLDNRKYIDQAINYAWHKGCTWAVLTNFESVSVFNAELKTEHPWQSRLKLLHCHEFLQRFDELWLLSRESFEQCLIDKEAEKWGKKTKKSPVDKQLLADFTKFRELLSKNITKLNQGKDLTEDELDESIQRILDRLIFIRNCEDRELEARTLISNLREWESKGRGHLIKSLREVLAYFDKEYNSKIFAHHLSDDLDIDNEILHEIIDGLYHTTDNSVFYDFSAIDADVLGTIYEQYLSHILKKTEKRAKLTESHAHRKEQGIYYTPPYVVEYIVRNTLGTLLKDKKINAEKLRVLDPACGSGSFLIKAFDVLNEYYRKKEDYGQTELDLKFGVPFTRKAKILQNNIFGIDLDRQAVEIAQLNLLLKITEKGHRLPMLEKNIKSGNSLIDDETLVSSKTFKWEEEFKNIMTENGFDVVIGNPPYVESRDIEDEQWAYYRKEYVSAHKRFDLSVLFIEKAIRVLKNHGLLGIIISNKFTASDYGFGIRKYILENCRIKQIIDVSNIDVFRDASTYPFIIILEKERNKNARESNIIKVKKVAAKIGLEDDDSFSQITQASLLGSPNFIFSLDFTTEITKILDKMNSASTSLGEICEMKDGIHTGNVREKLILDHRKDDESKKLVTAESVNRYSLKWNGLWVDYRKEVIDKSNNEYGSLRNPRIFEAPEKLFTALFGLRPEVAYDDKKLYANNSIKVILAKRSNVILKCVLAMLNSSLMMFYYRVFFASTHVRGGYIQFYPQDFLKLPIKEISEKDKIQMVKLVDDMLSLNERLNDLGDKKTDERTKLEEEIRKKDAEIDSMVYQVYGISQDERIIIENSLKQYGGVP